MLRSVQIHLEGSRSLWEPPRFLLRTFAVRLLRGDRSPAQALLRVEREDLQHLCTCAAREPHARLLGSWNAGL